MMPRILWINVKTYWKFYNGTPRSADSGITSSIMKNGLKRQETEILGLSRRYEEITEYSVVVNVWNHKIQLKDTHK